MGGVGLPLRKVVACYVIDGLYGRMLEAPTRELSHPRTGADKAGNSWHEPPQDHSPMWSARNFVVAAHAAIDFVDLKLIRARLACPPSPRGGGWGM